MTARRWKQWLYAGPSSRYDPAQGNEVHRFVPSALLKREDLDPCIPACLVARDACRGEEVVGGRISKVSDTVVYRSWSGQPAVNEVEVTRNPLGPFKDIGPPTAIGAVPTK